MKNAQTYVGGLSQIISLVAETGKRAITIVQSFFAVSIPLRCALQESE